jgi:hypothetical protein
MLVARRVMHSIKYAMKTCYDILSGGAVRQCGVGQILPYSGGEKVMHNTAWCYACS